MFDAEMASLYFEILAVCAVFDLFSFILYVWDKKKAIEHKWRIPEWVLLCSAILGGIGAFVGMHISHHKTKKSYFRIWVGLFAVLQLLLALFAVAVLLKTAAAAAGWFGKGVSNLFKTISDNYVPD